MAEWSYCEYRIAGDPEELDRLFGIMHKVENSEGGPWLRALMAEINGEEAEDARGQWSELKREEDCVSFIFEGAYRTYIEEWDEVCDNFETLCPYFEGVLWALELAQKRENPEKGWFPNKYYLDMRYKEYGDDEARSFRTLEDVYKRIEELTGTKISSEEDVEALRSALEEENDDTFIHIYKIEEISRGGSGYHTLFPWGDMSDWEIEEVDDDIPKDTSGMTSMQAMFLLSGETTLDLSSFDTSKVVDMSNMFDGCSALSTLDLSSFDTSNVKDMSYMFCDCTELTTLDLSSFDTSNVKDISYMFCDCTELTTLDLSSFDTSKVTKMTCMFSECTRLTSLDLSSFNTSKVTCMFGLFMNCKKLTSLDLSNFVISEETDISRMFDGCDSLKTVIMRNCSDATVTKIKSVLPEGVEIIR